MGLNKRKIFENGGPILLIISSIVISIIFLIVASFRQLTNLEMMFFQIFVLGTGLLGSYTFGKSSARKTTMELLKPHARSAIRRLISLFNGLGRIAHDIADNDKNEEGKNTQDKIILSKIKARVTEIIYTADDAMEDWSDIVPDEVEKLKKSSNKEISNV